MLRSPRSRLHVFMKNQIAVRKFERGGWRPGIGAGWVPIRLTLLTWQPIATMSSSGSLSRGEFFSLRTRRRLVMASLIDFSRLVTPSRSQWSRVWIRCSNKDFLAAAESEAGSGIIGERLCSPSDDSLVSFMAEGVSVFWWLKGTEHCSSRRLT